MIDLPLRAFCIMGNNGMDKIEIIINEMFGFPNETTYEGGYDFKGALIIIAGSYKIHSEDFYSSTGVLHGFNTCLKKCYDTLTGTAKYARMFEEDLKFELRMTNQGHALIDGEFREYPHLPNKLSFQIETDQTCIYNAIIDLRHIEKLFGGYNGKQPQ